MYVLGAGTASTSVLLFFLYFVIFKRCTQSKCSASYDGQSSGKSQVCMLFYREKWIKPYVTTLKTQIDSLHYSFRKYWKVKVTFQTSIKTLYSQFVMFSVTLQGTQVKVVFSFCSRAFIMGVGAQHDQRAEGPLKLAAAEKPLMC